MSNPTVQEAAQALINALTKHRTNLAVGLGVVSGQRVKEAEEVLRAALAAPAPVEPAQTTRLRSLLLVCAEAMRISMMNGGRTDWTHMINGIDDALGAQKDPE